MTGIDRFAVVVLVVALTTVTVAQDAVQKLPPDAAGLRVNQVVTVCGEALDLGCHGPQRDAILTFITPSASPFVTVGAAPGEQIDVDTRSLVRAQRICVTGKVAAVAGGYQLQIASRDQIVFSTQPTPVTDVSDLPRRSCERGLVIPRVRRDVKPLYTADAMRRKVSGRVVLQGLVDTSGLVHDVQVIRSLDPGGFDMAAVDAFNQWRFTPGRSDGKTVPMMVVADMMFAMK